MIEAKKSVVAASRRGSSNPVEAGGKLIGSVVKAANQTAPLVANVQSSFWVNFTADPIIQIVQETVEQIPLVTGFASAYAEGPFLTCWEEVSFDYS